MLLDIFKISTQQVIQIDASVKRKRESSQAIISRLMSFLFFRVLKITISSTIFTLRLDHTKNGCIQWSKKLNTISTFHKN